MNSILSTLLFLFLYYGLTLEARTLLMRTGIGELSRSTFAMLSQLAIAYGLVPVLAGFLLSNASANRERPSRVLVIIASIVTGFSGAALLGNTVGASAVGVISNILLIGCFAVLGSFFEYRQQTKRWAFTALYIALTAYAGHMAIWPSAFHFAEQPAEILRTLHLAISAGLFSLVLGFVLAHFYDSKIERIAFITAIATVGELYKAFHYANGLGSYFGRPIFIGLDVVITAIALVAGSFAYDFLLKAKSKQAKSQ